MYCVDTSAFLHAWNRDYPIRAFPPVWDAVAQLGVAGRLIVPEMVFRELDRQKDGMADWLKTSIPDVIIWMDQEQQSAVKKILDRYPKMLQNRKGQRAADPFVVALALIRGATVVTDEAGGNERNPKIPSVCTAYGIKPISFRDVIAREDWRFG